MVPNPRTPLRADRLRALNLPRKVAVVLGESGLPQEVRELDMGTTGEQPSTTSSTSQTSPTSRRIATVGEVWRVDDEWWRVAIARRYVEVLLEGGKHVMLFEDLTTHEWFIQDI